MDDLEYYYVTYSCIGVITGAGVVKQRLVADRPKGDFNIAGASMYLYKLLGVPCIISHWALISAKRAEELNRFADKVIEKEGFGVTKGKDNVSHLRLVPEASAKAESSPPPPPLEPGPYAKT